MAFDQRKEAIAYALRTTGTLQWCPVGVFSGDGRKGLDAMRTHGITDATRKFVATRCVRFTPAENAAMIKRNRHQEARYARLAHLALAAGKYESASKLCDKAMWAARHAEEAIKGYRVMYRIIESTKDTN